MRLSPNIQDISCKDLRQLLLENAGEDLQLEFKEESPDSRIDSITQSIIAMANTGGGHILVGASERHGERNIISGFPGISTNPASLIEKISNKLQTDVIPRIHSCRMKDISVDSKNVLVIQVGQSSSRPHVFRNNNSFQYLTRNEHGRESGDFFRLKQEILFLAGQFEQIRLLLSSRYTDFASRFPADTGNSSRGAIQLQVIPVTNGNELAMNVFETCQKPFFNHDIDGYPQTARFMGGASFETCIDGIRSTNGLVTIRRDASIDACSDELSHRIESYYVISASKIKNLISECFARAKLLYDSLQFFGEVVVSAAFTDMAGVLPQDRQGPIFSSKPLDRNSFRISDRLLVLDDTFENESNRYVSHVLEVLAQGFQCPHFRSD